MVVEIQNIVDRFSAVIALLVVQHIVGMQLHERLNMKAKCCCHCFCVPPDWLGFPSYSSRVKEKLQHVGVIRHHSSEHQV